MSVSVLLQALPYACMALLALLLLRGIKRERRRRQRPEWFPDELRYAELLHEGKTFCIDQPVRLLARVDQAYRDWRKLTLMAYRTRHTVRVSQADVIELSVQKMVLEKATGTKVRGYAFVVINHPERSAQIAIKVFLLDSSEVEALYWRRTALLAQAATARYAESLSHCRRCEYASLCKALPPSVPPCGPGISRLPL